MSSRLEIDHVIVDGGSDDGTLEVASRYPSRVVVAADDEGMYDAVSRGMAVVRGDLVEYIDAVGRVLGRLTPERTTLRSFVGTGWSCIPGRPSGLGGRSTSVSVSSMPHIETAVITTSMRECFASSPR